MPRPGAALSRGLVRSSARCFNCTFSRSENTTAQFLPRSQSVFMPPRPVARRSKSRAALARGSASIKLPQHARPPFVRRAGSQTLGIPGTQRLDTLAFAVCIRKPAHCHPNSPPRLSNSISPPPSSPREPFASSLAVAPEDVLFFLS